MLHSRPRPLRVAIVAALGGSLLLPSVAAASPPRSPSWPAVAQFSHLHNSPLSARHQSTDQLNRGLLRLTYPAAVSRAPSAEITSDQQLQIQLPANAQNIVQGTIAPADADNPKINAFTILNDQTYVASGVVGGFQQDATLPIGATTDTAVLEWLGTYYGTDAQALARINETVTYLTGKNFQNASCGTNCYGYVLSFKSQSDNKTYDLIYNISSNQNAVGEFGMIVADDVLTANQTAVATLVGTLAAEGIAAVAGQQQTSVSIEDLELGHKLHGKIQPTHILKSGEKGYLVMLVQDPNKDTSGLQATATITSRGKIVGTATLQNLGVQSDGSILLSATFKLKTKKTKKYLADAVAQDGAAQDMKSITFKVKKKKKKK